jgi:hypothetical protein
VVPIDLRSSILGDPRKPDIDERSENMEFLYLCIGFSLGLAVGNIISHLRRGPK